MDELSKKHENYLVHILNAGFNRSAESFSRFIGKSIRIHTAQSILVRHANEFAYINEEVGDVYILTTQIIGEFSGKSYLILSEAECEEIFKSLHPQPERQSVELKEALLLEIDNIISASVIAELSNELGVEIYGDVPSIIKTQSHQLENFLMHDMTSSSNNSLVITNTAFQFDNHDHIHPQFIWKLSAKVFDIIPESKIHN